LIYTIGHSTRPIAELIDQLRSNGVRLLVDIRTVPRSRRNPQYDQTAIADTLRRSGVQYIHLPELGGRRHPRAESCNTGWQNESFRGYADYMATPAFASGLDRLLELSEKQGPLAIMCAEAVPWRCHRSLVADALVALCNVPVRHIVGAGPTRPHQLNPMARVVDRGLVYPDIGA
jgi:uncharacterized protein (DUF488 family)